MLFLYFIFDVYLYTNSIIILKMFCNTCYEEISDLYVCKCGMSYCDNCIIDIIIRYNFKCPNCNKLIKVNQLMNLMTIDRNIELLMKEYKIHRKEFKENWLNLFKYEVLKCNKCNNELTYRKPNYYCNKCNETVCFVCLNHHDKRCCSEKDFNEYCNNIKHCPKCMYKIYKSNGCDHMFCVNCKTGFNWETGKIINGYFENPERARLINHDKSYIEMNRDVVETYEMENVGFVTKLYNKIICNKTIILDELNDLVNKSDPTAIILFMEKYIKYRLKLKTLKVMHRNLYLYETIKDTHLTLINTVHHLIREMLNLKYKYIDEIEKEKIMILPIMKKDDIDALNKTGLYVYFIDCLIRLNGCRETDYIIDEPGTYLIKKYFNDETIILYY